MRSMAKLTCLMLLMALMGIFPLVAETLVKVIDPLDHLEALTFVGSAEIVPKGPKGEKVLHTKEEFKCVIHLKKLGIDPKEFDLVCVDVKSDAFAWTIYSLENYPEDGIKSNWYALDGARGAMDWTVVSSDLRFPEERRQVGKYASVASKGEGPVLTLSARVHDTKRKEQGEGRSVYLSNLRFVKKAVHIEWDQLSSKTTWANNGDLVTTYPMTLINKLSRKETFDLVLKPFEVKHATAKASEGTVTLGPGESRKVEVEIRLPAQVAKKATPLTCERFEAYAGIMGRPETRVTIIRSSDPIHLSVTVPVPEEKLSFPLLPRRKDLPLEMSRFSEKAMKVARQRADEFQMSDLDILNGPYLANAYVNQPMDNRSGLKETRRIKHALTSCAFLYDFTREKKYLEKGTAILLGLAKHFKRRYDIFHADDFRLSCSGILNKNTLGLGWGLTGMEQPYHYSLNHSNGYLNDFDILAADMDPKARETIIRDFLVPAAIRVRNHYFGLTNQQHTVNYACLYVGLITRNWPLVSFGYSSEHGVLNQIKWNYDEYGLANEGAYQKMCIFPTLWSTELLYQVGINKYDARWCMVLYSPSAWGTGKGYGNPKTGNLTFYNEQRFTPEILKQTLVTSDGIHTETGSTMLMWKGLGVGMNWGRNIFRGAPDRCSLRFDFGGRRSNHPLRRLHAQGGGTYDYSSFYQSLIMVDEMQQAEVDGEVVEVDVEGPIQFIQCQSDRFYPDSRVNRTYAIVDQHAFVIDRVTSDKPGRTVDWKFVTNRTELQVPLNMRIGSFTKKPDEPRKFISYGAKIGAYAHAKWGKDIRDTAKHMLMLGYRYTDIMLFPNKGGRNSILMIRRKPDPRAPKTDIKFASVFSAMVKSMQEVPVKRSDGSKAKALGYRVNLKNGKNFHALVNYEAPGVVVVLGDIRTKSRFASDYLNGQHKLLK